MIAIHIRRNSPKKLGARFSIYLQPQRKGISWKFFGSPKIFVRYTIDNNGIQTVRWVRSGFAVRKRTESGQAKIAALCYTLIRMFETHVKP